MNRSRTRYSLSEAQKQAIKTFKADLQASIDTPPSDESLTTLKTDLKQALSDRKLTQSEFQTLVNDVIAVADSTGLTATETRILFYDLQDIAEASRFPRTNDDLQGTDDSDLLWGGLGNDTLTGAGSTALGTGEIDSLIGGGGKDTFVLGNATTVFYNDATIGAGLLDYGLILDFNKKSDQIQLSGTVDDYTLAALPAELGLTGTGIYLKSSSQTNPTSLPELLGVVQGVTLTDFSAGFRFVS